MIESFWLLLVRHTRTRFQTFNMHNDRSFLCLVQNIFLHIAQHSWTRRRSFIASLHRSACKSTIVHQTLFYWYTSFNTRVGMFLPCWILPFELNLSTRRIRTDLISFLLSTGRSITNKWLLDNFGEISPYYSIAHWYSFIIRVHRLASQETLAHPPPSSFPRLSSPLPSFSSWIVNVAQQAFGRRYSPSHS